MMDSNVKLMQQFGQLCSQFGDWGLVVCKCVQNLFSFYFMQAPLFKCDPRPLVLMRQGADSAQTCFCKRLEIE